MKRLRLFDIVLANELNWIEIGPGLLDFSLPRPHNDQLIDTLLDLVLELDALHRRTILDQRRALLPEVLLLRRSVVELRE